MTEFAVVADIASAFVLMFGTYAVVAYSFVFDR